MADDKKSGTGNPVVDALVSALGTLTKDSLGALRPEHAIEGVPFPEVALAYEQMKFAAECIADAVKAKIPANTTHVLLDPDEKLPDLSAFRGFLTALEILTPLISKDVADARKTLDAQPDLEAFGLGLALIAPAISAALAIGAFFKTDVSEKYADIKIEDGALTGWVTKKLREKNVDVLSPGALASAYSEWRELSKDQKPTPDRLRAKLEALTKLVSDLHEMSGRIEQRLKQADKPDDKHSPEEKEKLAGMAARLTHSIESVKAFDDAFKGIAQSVFRGDLLHALLIDSGYVLSARILAGAGTVRMQTAGFERSTSYRAGVIVSYALLGKDSVVVDHDILVSDSDDKNQQEAKKKRKEDEERVKRSEKTDPNVELPS